MSAKMATPTPTTPGLLTDLLTAPEGGPVAFLQVTAPQEPPTRRSASNPARRKEVSS